MEISRVLKDLLSKLSFNEGESIEKERETLVKIKSEVVKREKEINEELNLSNIKIHVNNFANYFEFNIDICVVSKILKINKYEKWELKEYSIDLRKIDVINFSLVGGISNELDFYILIDPVFDGTKVAKIIIGKKGVKFNMDKEEKQKYLK